MSATLPPEISNVPRLQKEFAPWSCHYRAGARRLQCHVASAHASTFAISCFERVAVGGISGLAGRGAAGQVGDDDTVGAVLGDVEERAAKVAWFHRGLRRIGRWCVFGGYPIVFLINPSVKIPITIAGMYNNHGGVSQGPEFLTSALFAFSGDNT